MTDTVTLQDMRETQLEMKYSLPENHNGTVFLFIHWFKSSGTHSDKVAAMIDYFVPKWYGVAWYNMRWNNVAYPDAMAFEDMTYETMAEDVSMMYEYLLSLDNVERIVPVASSIWAAALLVAFEKEKSILDTTEHSFFLAPCLVYGKYTKLYCDPSTRDARKKKWRRTERHHKKKKSVKVTFDFVQNSLDREDELLAIAHNEARKMTVFHGSDDIVVPPREGKRFAGENEYIEIKGDNHRLSEDFPLVLDAMNKVLNG